MHNSKTNLHALSYISAFLIGVVLLWTFGNGWLNLESALVFLVGLVGVAVAVLGFAAWNLRNNSDRKEN
jgi:hypothetical protein